MTRDKYLIEVHGDKISLDPDNTDTSFIFYNKAFKIFDDLSVDNRFLSADKTPNGIYRGETILSFNTIAGIIIRLYLITVNKKIKMPSDDEERLDLILSNVGNSELETELKAKLILFHYYYHTKANFMVWPKPCSKKSTEDLNLLKGSVTYHFHDFPDKFFDHIQKNLFLNGDFKSLEGSTVPSEFEDVNNMNFFKHFSTWDEFVKTFYLQPFFTDDTFQEFKKLAPNEISKNAEKWAFPYQQNIKPDYLRDNREKIIPYIIQSLNQMISIIEERADLLAKDNVLD